MAETSPFLHRFSRYLDAHHAEISRRIVEETYRAVPGYENVPRDDFFVRTETTLDFAISLLAEGRLPAQSDFAFDRETVRRRVNQGVRAKEWLAAGRVFFGILRDEGECFGAAEGVEEAATMAGLLTLERIGEAAVAYAADEFEAATDELLREDEAERREFVSALLRGALTPAAIRSGIEAIGLDPSRLYRAVRIRSVVASETDGLLRRVLRSEPTVSPRGVWAGIHGDVCGISQDGVSADVADATAGVGPAVPLEAVASSFAVATSALETAFRFGRRGAYTLEDLGALPLVLGSSSAGAALVERFVDRLERDGAAGEALVATVAEYLHRGLQVGVTADALHLHPNSLRKRLRRYEQLTGADLGSIDDLAAIWCALKRRELDADPAPAASA